VVVHRWAGLTLALFLAVAGLTGILLAWEDDLEALTAPHLLRSRPPVAGAAMRDVPELVTGALARHPGMAVSYLPLSVEPGKTLRLRVVWNDPRAAPDWDELFIDPYSGAELGHRRWGDITQGISNLMPMLYRLHYSLLIDRTGEIIMGVASILWALDCFVGFYLTLPVRVAGRGPARGPAARRGKGWLARWRPSWAVRWGAHGYKLNFDLHRAGGLWIWPLLLVFAVSSFSLNLPTLYAPMVQALGARDSNAVFAEPLLPAPRLTPRIDLAGAQRRGAALARQEAARAGATINPQGLRWLWNAPAQGVYIYGFTTGGDVSDLGGSSRLAFDSDSGRLIAVQLADTAPAASRMTDWIVVLHMANVWGTPWRIAVSLIGVMVTMLSVTGIVIWTKKRSGRLHRRAHPRHGPGQHPA
jgi:uncharacterized iron-regulated membrane protein